ncbi:MAG: hypothetical protein LBC41_05085 [Clostridiales bacterium]|nr:hypothetical protein [Clostridiales bacterium]
MRNNVSKLFSSDDYANAKNSASYLLGESILKSDDWAAYYLALSASALGDYYLADEILRYFLFARPDLKVTTTEIKSNELRRKLCKPQKFKFFDGIEPYEYKPSEYEPLSFDDDFAKNAFKMISLRGTMGYMKTDKKAAFFELLKRISSSFTLINKPISVYLIKDGDTFLKVFEKVVKPPKGSDIFIWKGAAAGFYTDPKSYILFVDYKYLERDIVKTVGCMAHELMHFEQNSTGLRRIFSLLPLSTSGFREKESLLFNERVTDLQVISRGFGYELHCDRRDLGMYCLTNFDQYDVLKIMDAGSRQ